MPSAFLLKNHRWKRPWPLVLRDLQDSGLLARIQMPARRIEVESETVKSAAIQNALRRARHGPRSGRGVLMPSVVALALGLLVTSVLTMAPTSPSAVVSTVPRQGIGCEESLLQTFAQKASQIREQDLSQWNRTLSQGLPGSLNVSVNNQEELGGYASLQVFVEQSDCQLVRLSIELTRSSAIWTIKKITRQP